MERAFKCDLCSEKFVSWSKLNLHVGREHGKPGELAKKNCKCDECGYECSFKSLFIVHMRVHTGERPFNCTVAGCGKAFKTITDMKTHMRIHTGERPFKCTVGDCETKFIRKSDLNRHIEVIHSGERPFKCNWPGCKYRAKTYSVLRQHTNTHSDDRPFACPNKGCDFRTKQKSQLTNHLKAAHSGVKAFACSECDYKVAQKSSLNSHMLRRHSTIGDNTKCSHSECTEYLICSYDLDCLLSNQDKASSTQCDQSGNEQRLADATVLYDTSRDADSGQGVVCPRMNSTSCSTNMAEDFHNSEAENRENMRPNIFQTLSGLSKDPGFSCDPDVKPGSDGNEHECFHQGFNWFDILHN